MSSMLQLFDHLLCWVEHVWKAYMFGLIVPSLQELSDQTGGDFDNNDVRWVITVPAIWKMPAKQFMREAAYKVHPELDTHILTVSV